MIAIAALHSASNWWQVVLAKYKAGRQGMPKRKVVLTLPPGSWLVQAKIPVRDILKKKKQHV